MCVFHVEVREIGNLKPSLQVGIVVDRLPYSIDEADDDLGHVVAGGRFSSKDKGSRRETGLVPLKREVAMDSVKGIQLLPFVPVNALDLDIEERSRIDLDAGPLPNELRKLPFIREFHLMP